MLLDFVVWSLLCLGVGALVVKVYFTCFDFMFLHAVSEVGLMTGFGGFFLWDDIKYIVHFPSSLGFG